MASLPLTGVRVLDLSRVLAGPLCTMILGDLGADVIKVERPGRGDDTREWGPPFDDAGASAYFLSVNRNKLSLAADLRADRELIVHLVANADVVVENFLPGALARAGLDASELVARHTVLVWCTLTGFGPASTRPGYDFVVQAESGWMSVTGESKGEPMKSGIALADVVAGKDAAIAILAALAALRLGASAERRLTISLVDSARAALVNVAQNVLVSGRDAARWGNAHANLVPYQLFHAQDRGIVVAVGNDGQWRACVAALGLAGLAEDERLHSNRGRIQHRERVVRAMEVAIAQRPAADCQRVLESAGVPCGLVKTVAESIADAGTASARWGMPPLRGGAVRLPPPALDQHGPAIRARGWRVFRDLADAR